MTSCMIEEYRHAQELAEAGSDDAACREIFGLTPLELGHELLKAANLPEDILAAVRELSPQALAVLDSTPDSQTLMLADFSARLAGLSLAANVSSADYMGRVGELAAKYEKFLPNVAAEVPDLVENAGRQLDSFVRTFHLKSLPTRSLNRLTQRRAVFAEVRRKTAAGLATAGPGGPATAAVKGSALEPPETSAGFELPDIQFARKASGESGSRDLAPLPNKEISGGARPVPAAAAQSGPADWQKQVDRISGLVDKPGVSDDHILGAVIQAVCQIMVAPECLLILGSPEKPIFRLRHGHGPVFKSLGGRAQIDVRDRTVLGVCLVRKENVMIHHAHDPKIVGYLPDWLKANRSLGSYALLPLFDEKGSYGVMLVGWPDTRQIVLSPDQIRYIRSLLAIACTSSKRLAA